MTQTRCGCWDLLVADELGFFRFASKHTAPDNPFFCDGNIPVSARCSFITPYVVRRVADDSQTLIAGDSLLLLPHHETQLVPVI